MFEVYFDFNAVIRMAGLTSEMSPSSCRAVVGVAEGELLCCKRSGRLPRLP